jgi:dihydrofolate reductase
MRTLSVFNSVSLDGYFVDRHGDMSWAHQNSDDPEWGSFVQGNASGGGVLAFGRVTYQMMANYWSSPIAMQSNPVVADRMNALPKIVFSRTLRDAPWRNTTLVKGDLPAEVRRLKSAPGEGIVILGSGTIIAQLAAEGLIDQYQIVVTPIVLGAGRTMFDGVANRLRLKLVESRTFRNGNVVLSYQPMT